MPLALWTAACSPAPGCRRDPRHEEGNLVAQADGKTGRDMKILGLALIALAAASGWAEQSKPLAGSYDSVIETIQFTDVSEVRQKQVLSSLGLRVGDRFTVQARHRIGLALGTAQSSVAEKRQEPSGARPNC